MHTTFKCLLAKHEQNTLTITPPQYERKAYRLEGFHQMMKNRIIILNLLTAL